MTRSQDMIRYFEWAAVVLAGVLCAFVDWRWIKRPVFGVLLVAGIVGGTIVTNVSPFNFATGGYYMEGVLLAASSALALAGYVFAIVVQFIWRRIRGHDRS
jgi:hypothetical protein